MKVRREVVRPPPEAPHWFPATDASGPLLYLGWGRRRYGRNPVPLRRHAGWTYTVIKEGTPTLRVHGDAIRTEAGSLVVVGPDVLSGWSDKPDGECQILVWLWEKPPLLGEKRWLAPDQYWLQPATPATVRELEQWHRQTRREIHLADGHTGRACAALQQLIDAGLMRAGLVGRSPPVQDDQRLRLAYQWMREHIEGHASIRDLADYLGLSMMTLQRLFTRRAGTSPGRAFRTMKLQEAHRRLQSTPDIIKAIGLHLGYRNPGDFTRAFTRHFGYPPSAVRP